MARVAPSRTKISGVTARLEPATIDGLVYATSMVNLYAARQVLVAGAGEGRG